MAAIDPEAANNAPAVVAANEPEDEFENTPSLRRGVTVFVVNTVNPRLINYSKPLTLAFLIGTSTAVISTILFLWQMLRETTSCMDTPTRELSFFQLFGDYNNHWHILNPLMAEDGTVAEMSGGKGTTMVINKTVRTEIDICIINSFVVVNTNEWILGDNLNKVTPIVENRIVFLGQGGVDSHPIMGQLPCKPRPEWMAGQRMVQKCVQDGDCPRDPDRYATDPNGPFTLVFQSKPLGIGGINIGNKAITGCGGIIPHDDKPDDHRCPLGNFQGVTSPFTGSYQKMVRTYTRDCTTIKIAFTEAAATAMAWSAYIELCVTIMIVPCLICCRVVKTKRKITYSDLLNLKGTSWIVAQKGGVATVGQATDATA